MRFSLSAPAQLLFYSNATGQSKPPATGRLISELSLIAKTSERLSTHLLPHTHASSALSFPRLNCAAHLQFSL